MQVLLSLSFTTLAKVLLDQTFDINSGRETKLLVDMVLTRKISCSVLDCVGLSFLCLQLPWDIYIYIYIYIY
jgi:hypothetical protein